ncbi:MAG: dihydropteroate synthase [Chitinophagia bacterium]|nr:dihydropteroate synthase [Chitinophagia bacterium]
MQIQVLPTSRSIASQGRILQLDRPVVMGILNATPDSFFNKGRDSDVEGLLHTAGTMLEQGAVILDVGGASTRPGQPLMAPQEELDRIMPAITAITKAFPGAWLSVDTYNAAVAAAAVKAGVHIINDVSAGNIDAGMLATAGQLGVPYIAMHMQGLPENMQHNPQYTHVVQEVLQLLRDACDRATAAGVTDIIVDPGFGFGKTLQHNFALLNHLHVFKILGRPILAGISRKSMICRALGITPAEALNGTTALHMVALQQGADILRVHDVKEAIEVLTLYPSLTHNNG